MCSSRRWRSTRAPNAVSSSRMRSSVVEVMSRVTAARPEAHHTPTPTDIEPLAHLLRRADQDLVDRHVSRARDDVEDRVGDVLRGEDLLEARRELAADLLADVSDELALGGAGLDQRRADVPGRDLLAQGL